MCTEYLFNGEEVRTLGELIARVDQERLAVHGGPTLAEYLTDRSDRLDFCLCGWNVREAALASGWHETDPPEGDDWFYGGVFAREGG